MAVDAEQVDAIAASVADIYREAELALVRLVTRHLDEGLDSPAAEQRLTTIRALRRGAQSVIATLEADSGPRIRGALGSAYRHGWRNALAELPEGVFPNSGIGQAAREAARERSGTSFVESLAQALHQDFGNVTRNVLRNVEDAYRSVQAAAAGRILTGSQTRRQAAQSAWQRLVDRGIMSFTDRAGRRWRLSSYVEMATRTNAQRAATTGQVDRLDSIGVNLVLVSDAPQECKKCRPFEGRILRTDDGPLEVEVEHPTRDGVMVKVEVFATLDQARARGLYHPNCRHSVSIYLPGVSRLPDRPTADPEGSAARERQRELERRIRKYKERAEAALTPEAKKAANVRVRRAQADLRAHLKANPQLKRLRYREQIGGGNIPPRTTRGTDPAGDLNPPVEPTLDGGPAPAPPQRTGRRPVEPLVDDGPRPGPDQPELEAPPAPRRNPRDLSDTELEEQMMAAVTDDPDEFNRLAAELDRREAATRAAEERQQALADRFNELMDDGWDEIEAAAEAYGISVDQARRDRAIADLRSQGYTGDRFEDLARQAYRDHLQVQYLDASSGTRGVLLNNDGYAAGIDERELWTRNETFARRYASEELRDWWDRNGRATFAEFKAMLTDDPTALRRQRESGGGDFLA